MSETIKEIKFYIPSDRKEEIINALHEKGICQIKKTVKDIPDMCKEMTLIKKDVDKIHEKLLEHKPFINIEGGIKALFNPSAPKKFESVRKKNWLKDLKNQLNTIGIKLLELESELESTEEALDNNRNIISALKLLPNIPTNEFNETNNLKWEIGIIPQDAVPLLEMDKAIAVIEPINLSESLICMIDMKDSHTYKSLQENGFRPLEFPRTDEKPGKIQKELHDENSGLRKKIMIIKKQLKQLAIDNEREFAIYSEELRIEAERLDVLANPDESSCFSIQEAWVPEKNLDKFNALLKKYSSDYLYEEDEKEDGPTLLKNSKLAKPFELITGLYSLPKYKRFDPTIFIAFTFPLFFGIMLTDVVYGIALTLFAYALVRGVGKNDEGIRNFSMLLVLCGISTIVMGAVFGSYFGNFFQMIGLKVPLILDSMKDIMPMIAIVLTIGLIHMTMGLVVGFMENLKQKKVRDAFANQGVWLSFVMAIVFLVTSMMVTIQSLQMIGFAFLGLAVLMQFGFNYQKDGPISAVLSLFNFSGFLGDLFSYIRIMALAIGTSGIALAVNFMTFLANDMIPYVGIIFAIIVFVIGHLFNMAMNGLGAFIHTLRLHFLEHFSKYYDGGGQEYTPFYANRKLTRYEVE
ncbi:V-type ATP synthase subunit I [Candidatus Woesearchaeota archaeon]|nr:V-type ATP synthase subunit I [Candidatus Woesearchaeota archaeon]